MSDIETLKAELKKLNARATQAKMDLHDLSEELPAFRIVACDGAEKHDEVLRLHRKQTTEHDLTVWVPHADREEQAGDSAA